MEWNGGRRARRADSIIPMTTQPSVPVTPAPARSRARLWIVGFVLLGAAIYGYNYFWGSAADAAKPRGRFGGMGGPQGPVPVRLAPVTRETIDVEVRALGTVTPLNTVTVRNRLDGELIRVNFTEGQTVAEGQLLAEIDPRPYEVALNQVQGQLEENRARMKNAQGDLARYQKLQSEGLITSQQVTTQEALVQQYQGALQANEAQVSNARLQLTYTRVVAPISGRLGLRQVDAGNLVRSGDANGLVVITQMRPISVLFTVPEAELPAVLQAMHKGQRLPVEAWDRSEKLRIATGVLKTVDNQIDTATGSIKLRAEFSNETELLFPNQFVNIRLRVSRLENVPVIPSASVQRASFGTFVYVAKDGKVAIRRITLGPANADKVSIPSGLEPGEQVVLEGVDELTDGAKVEAITGDGSARPRRAAGAGAQGAATPGAPARSGGGR
jgi:multidrug efflux system membrane fusion protein